MSCTLQPIDKSPFHGVKIFKEFFKTPDYLPSDYIEISNKKFVDQKSQELFGELDEEQSQKIKRFANLTPRVYGKYLTAADTDKVRIIGVNSKKEDSDEDPPSVVIASSSIQEGNILYIKDEAGNAALNNITVATENDEKIEELDQVKINNNFGCLVLYSDGVGLFNLNSSIFILGPEPETEVEPSASPSMSPSPS